jgi:5-methylcytosine-specific restriction endonuclease McrA
MNGVADSRVLVLNRLWQAVNTCSVERAIALLYVGHAQVVYEDDGDFNTFSFSQWCDLSRQHQGDDLLHTISMRIRIPRIIVLAFFDRLPKKEVKFTRNNLFERDKNTCQYCGKKFDRKDLNIDHVVPRQRGGLTTWTNVVCSCIPCNRRKGSRTPEEANMHLINVPRKPRWRPFVEIKFLQGADHSWRHFVDLAYWNVELGHDD